MAPSSIPQMMPSPPPYCMPIMNRNPPTRGPNVSRSARSPSQSCRHTRHSIQRGAACLRRAKRVTHKSWSCRSGLAPKRRRQQQRSPRMQQRSPPSSPRRPKLPSTASRPPPPSPPRIRPPRIPPLRPLRRPRASSAKATSTARAARPRASGKLGSAARPRKASTRPAATEDQRTRTRHLPGCTLQACAAPYIIPASWPLPRSPF